MSLAAWMPSSSKFFSICLLRARAALSSALSAQPIFLIVLMFAACPNSLKNHTTSGVVGGGGCVARGRWPSASRPGRLQEHTPIYGLDARTLARPALGSVATRSSRTAYDRCGRGDARIAAESGRTQMSDTDRPKTPKPTICGCACSVRSRSSLTSDCSTTWRAGRVGTRAGAG
jgi:hypothetical protein